MTVDIKGKDIFLWEEKYGIVYSFRDIRWCGSEYCFYLDYLIRGNGSDYKVVVKVDISKVRFSKEKGIQEIDYHLKYQGLEQVIESGISQEKLTLLLKEEVEGILGILKMKLLEIFEENE